VPLNFGFRTIHRPLTVDTLTEQIARYDATAAAAVCQRVRAEADLHTTVDAIVRLYEEVLAENKDYVPGCYIVQHGYIVFATTIFGDAFCFDTKTASGQEAPIVLIAHDGYDWDAVTSEEIARLKKPIAADFRGFLQNYVDGTLDIQPNYDPLP